MKEENAVKIHLWVFILEKKKQIANKPEQFYA